MRRVQGRASGMRQLRLLQWQAGYQKGYLRTNVRLVFRKPRGCLTVRSTGSVGGKPLFFIFGLTNHKEHAIIFEGFAKSILAGGFGLLMRIGREGYVKAGWGGRWPAKRGQIDSV